MKKLSRKHKNTILVLAFSAIFLIAALSPLTPGAEIQTRMMINSLGIDVTEEGVLVTAETINGGDNEIVSGTGSILSDALQNLNERYGRNVELGHCGLVALGKDLKRGDVVSIFMSILSDAKINAGCSVVATQDSAHKFMSDAVLLTKSTGEGITGFVTFADSQASVTVPSVLELMQALVSKSGTAVLPVIGMREKPEQKGQGENDSQSSGEGDTASSSPQQDKGSKETEIMPPSVARIVGNEVYELDKDVTRGLIWLTPRSTGGLSESPFELDGKLYTIRAILKNKSSGISAEFAGGKPVITLRVDAQFKFTDRYAMLAEVEAGKTMREVFDGMNASFEQTIEKEVRAIADASLKDDFLGFRTQLYRTDPQKYHAWSGDMSEIELKFDIKAAVL